MKRAPFVVTALCLLLVNPPLAGAQGINPITPPTNWLIQVIPPIQANPSNFYVTTASVSSLVIGTTPITGGATTQVLFNNGGFVGSDAGLTKAAGATGLVTFGGAISVSSNAQLGVGGGNTIIYNTLFMGGLSSSLISAPSNGNIKMTNNAGTSFGLLQLGGTTSSYPAIGISSAAINFRLADNSADTSIIASTATLSALANAATTSAVCYNTGTGVLSYDGTAGTCTTSALWRKNLIGVIDRDDEPLEVLRPIIYTYKRDEVGIGDDRIHVGLAADDVEKMDPRCVIYDTKGRLSNYEDRCVLAYLVESVNKISLRKK